MSTNGPFACPRCRRPLAHNALTKSSRCDGCDGPLDVVDGIPILVRDPQAIQTAIDQARRAGRGDWYEAPQAEQWIGVWRHHLLKRKAYVESVLSSYASARPRPERLLDLGCGDGEHLKWLRAYAEEIHGSDYNLIRLARAAAVEGVTCVVMADVTDYPAEDASFDIVYFNHVLEHVPDAPRALAEVRRIVRPGGIVVLGVPNEGALFWRLAYRLQPEFRELSDHVHFFTMDDLRDRCTKAGLRVLQEKPIGWGVPHWTLDSMLRGRRWVDDLFESVGRRMLRSQATSLYLILERG